MSTPCIVAAMGMLLFGASPETQRRADANGPGEKGAVALPLLSWALSLVDDDLDAPRIAPTTCVVSALKAIEGSFAGVAVRGGVDSPSLRIDVEAASRRIDLVPVNGIEEARRAIADAIGFVQGAGNHTPLEVEYAAVGGVLSILEGRRSRLDPEGATAALGRSLVLEHAQIATRAENIRRIDGLFREVRSLVAKDTYAAYLDAATRCEEILRLDGDSFAGHVYLAYIDALRANEHGDPVTADAVEHVRRAHALLPRLHARAAASARRMIEEGDVDGAKLVLGADRRTGRHVLLVAARAYLALSNGDVGEARRIVEGSLGADPAAPSPLLLGALGLIRLQDDPEAARAVLARARDANPADVRATWLLAEALRRRGGRAAEAVDLYGRALQLNEEHLGSLLGRALARIDLGDLEGAERTVATVLGSGNRASRREQALANAIHARVLAAGGTNLRTE